MSIIYDALKKVEGKLYGPNAHIPGQRESTALSPFKIGLVAAVVLITGYALAQMIFSSQFMQNIIRKSASLPEATTQSRPSAAVTVSAPARPEASPEDKPTAPRQTAYVLNGIFSANNASYALINNTIVQVGDTIQEAKVVGITTTSVDLEENGKPLKLTTQK